MKNNNKLANQSIRQLLALMRKLNLPTTICELGVDVFKENNLDKIVDFTCRDESEIHFLPFKVKKEDILETITKFEKQEIRI